MNTDVKRAEILKFICLGLSYAFSYGYVCLFTNTDSNLTVCTILCGLAVVAVIWLELTMWQQQLLGRFLPTKLQKIEPRFWEVILLLLCVTTYGNQMTGTTLLFIHAVAIYMVLVGTGHLLSDRSSCLMPLDLVNGFVRMPFRNILSRIFSVYDTVHEHNIQKSEGAESETTEKTRPRYNIIGIIGVLCMILIIFCLALENLAKVDDHFLYALESIDRFLSKISLSIVIVKFLFSIPIGAFLFGLYQGSVRTSIEKEKEFHSKVVTESKKLRFMPDTLYSIVLGIFILVYLAFCLSQASYMFSAFAGVLPEAYTASQYAVSGFHELINVVLINFVLLSLVRIFGSHENRILKILSTVIMAQSMVFACISASKIILYVSRFGYTPSRTLGLWGTAVVFVGSALAIVHLLTKKRTFTPWLWFSAGSYVTMVFIAWGIVSR
ncbi:MAG: DUF4173 domain-containing protein [Clostridiales bacterium]|nr:DUF4173 domain-containing protein [Clostridiales bacterium]